MKLNVEWECSTLLNETDLITYFERLIYTKKIVKTILVLAETEQKNVNKLPMNARKKEERKICKISTMRKKKFCFVSDELQYKFTTRSTQQQPKIEEKKRTNNKFL